MARTASWRTAAVESLDLSPGDAVVDVACGTGLNFAAIEQRIGPEGKLYGVDLSADMLERAAERVQRSSWRNVELVEADIERMELPIRADAALFSFTHDVLRSERAVAGVVAQLEPLARVATVGACTSVRWSPVNLVVRLAVRPFVVDRTGLDAPWRQLGRFAQLDHRSFALGGVCLATGRLLPGAGGDAEGLLRGLGRRSGGGDAEQNESEG